VIKQVKNFQLNDFMRMLEPDENFKNNVPSDTRNLLMGRVGRKRKLEKKNDEIKLKI